jgi:hypothetical protein
VQSAKYRKSAMPARERCTPYAGWPPAGRSARWGWFARLGLIGSRVTWSGRSGWSTWPPLAAQSVFRRVFLTDSPP